MSEAPQITVYGMSSPNVQKVMLMLEELGLHYAARHISVFKGDQFMPEFLAMNPAGKVPVLTDPALDHPMAESGAILIWLAEHYGAFLPVEAPARYEVLQWLMVQMASIGPMLGQFNHFQILGPDSEPYSHGRYHAQSERLYRLLDERLARRDWIAGGDYSIADIAIFPWAPYLERHGFDPADFPALVKWREKIAMRPAAIRMYARLGEAFNAATAEAFRTVTAYDLERFFLRTSDMPETDYSSVTRMR